MALHGPYPTAVFGGLSSPGEDGDAAVGLSFRHFEALGLLPIVVSVCLFSYGVKDNKFLENEAIYSL